MVEYLDGGRIQGSSTLTVPPEQTAWKQVGYEKLTSAATSITCSFTPKDYMMFLFFRPSQSSISGNGIIRLGYNSVDNQSNYGWKMQAYGGSDSNSSSATGFAEWDTSTAGRFDVINMVNIANQQKMLIGHNNISKDAGVANAPFRIEYVARWNNTSNQANRIYFAPTTSGSGFAAGTEIVALGYDLDEADTGATFWKELYTKTLDSTVNEIDTGDFAEKKYLMIQLNAVADGTISGSDLQFNGDTGTSYNRRYNSNQETENQSNPTGGSGETTLGGGTGGAISQNYWYIVNHADNEKLAIGQATWGATGESSVPDRRELTGKWVGTAQIKSIKIKENGSGGWGAGTTLKVWGADPV